jgi:UPF0716 family protein affecting phage T7 exclusion
MSASFIGIALLAAVLIVNWRLVLLVLSACLLALLLMGLGVADSEAVADGAAQAPASAPADPGQALVEGAAPTTK